MNITNRLFISAALLLCAETVFCAEQSTETTMQEPYDDLLTLQRIKCINGGTTINPDYFTLTSDDEKHIYPFCKKQIDLLSEIAEEKTSDSTLRMNLFKNFSLQDLPRLVECAKNLGFKKIAKLAFLIAPLIAKLAHEPIITETFLRGNEPLMQTIALLDTMKCPHLIRFSTEKTFLREVPITGLDAQDHYLGHSDNGRFYLSYREPIISIHESHTGIAFYKIPELAPLESALVSSTGNLIVCTLRNKDTFIYDASCDKFKIFRANFDIKNVIFNPDGKSVALCTSSQGVYFWSQECWWQDTEALPAALPAFSPKGKFFTYRMHNQLRIKNSLLNQVESPTSAITFPDQPHAFVFSSDENRLAVAYGNRLTFFRITTKQTDTDIEEFFTKYHTASVKNLTFSPKRTFFAYTVENTLHIENISSDTHMISNQVHASDRAPLKNIVFSPNETMIAVVMDNTAIKVIDISRKPFSDAFSDIQCPTPVETVTFSPDSKSLFITHNNTIKHFDIASQKIVLQLPLENTQPITAFQIDDEGETISVRQGLKKNYVFNKINTHPHHYFPECSAKQRTLLHALTTECQDGNAELKQLPPAIIALFKSIRPDHRSFGALKDIDTIHFFSPSLIPDYTENCAICLNPLNAEQDDEGTLLGKPMTCTCPSAHQFHATCGKQIINTPITDDLNTLMPYCPLCKHPIARELFSHEVAQLLFKNLELKIREVPTLTIPDNTHQVTGISSNFERKFGMLPYALKDQLRTLQKELSATLKSHTRLDKKI